MEQHSSDATPAVEQHRNGTALIRRHTSCGTTQKWNSTHQTPHQLWNNIEMEQHSSDATPAVEQHRNGTALIRRHTSCGTTQVTQDTRPTGVERHYSSGRHGVPEWYGTDHQRHTCTNYGATCTNNGATYIRHNASGCTARHTWKANYTRVVLEFDSIHKILNKVRIQSFMLKELFDG